jgi:DNA-binding transcriptional regulator YiaG
MWLNSWADFASRVDEARQREHLSIRQFAIAAGVPKATAQGWLNGRHMPTPALRPRYLRVVAELGLGDQVPDGMWAEAGE